MPFPVKPAQFRKLVVKPEDSLAAALIKAGILFPIAWWKNYRYMWKEDGTMTAQFQQDHCDIGCNKPS